MQFTRYATMLLRLTALIFVGVLCASAIYGVILLIVSAQARDATFVFLRLQKTYEYVPPPQDADLFDLSRSQQDQLSVWPDHNSISRWVLHCMGMRLDKPEQIMSAIVWRNFDLASYRPTYVAPDASWPTGIRPPDHKEQMLIELTRTLADQRLSLLSKVRSTYAWWQIATWISIGLGMITTILVSVSATDFGRGDGTRPQLIRVLAIIFPAMGTAAAAVIAFYSPQGEWGQASRTLASVSLLHSQIVFGVWNLQCPQAETDTDVDFKKLTAALDDWTKRYTDIQTLSNATSGGSGSQGSGGGSSPQGGSSGGNQAAPTPGSKPTPP
jgi:uncharacterized membrane protein YgcG